MVKVINWINGFKEVYLYCCIFYFLFYKEIYLANYINFINNIF